MSENLIDHIGEGSSSLTHCLFPHLTPMDATDQWNRFFESEPVREFVTVLVKYLDNLPLPGHGEIITVTILPEGFFESAAELLDSTELTLVQKAATFFKFVTTTHRQANDYYQQRIFRHLGGQLRRANTDFSEVDNMLKNILNNE